MLCTQVEDAMKVDKRIGFELIIETALGMQNINEIASIHEGLNLYILVWQIMLPLQKPKLLL